MEISRIYCKKGGLMPFSSCISCGAMCRTGICPPCRKRKDLENEEKRLLAIEFRLDEIDKRIDKMRDK